MSKRSLVGRQVSGLRDVTLESQVIRDANVSMKASAFQ